MDIKQLRTELETALGEAGLVETKLVPKRPKVWALPGAEIVRFFQSSPHRHPWGFVHYGGIGLEIPALRKWLGAHRPGDAAGIFRTHFISYHTANDDVLGRFMIEHGEAVPADLWAGLVADRLAEIPDSVDALIQTYRRNRERLGWLGHPHQRHAWDFLLAWHQSPNVDLHVPRMLPDGRIV